MTLVIILAVLFLAYANGANDNFKGVATLFGSRTTTFNRALAWATFTTLLGSVSALLLAEGLIATFSGKGLVPDVVLADSYFASSVALGAALTVFLATKLGFPISTTHALTGALVGAGLVMSPSGVAFSKLGAAFVLPLIVSPFISTLLAGLLYPVAKLARAKCGVTAKSCLCIGNEVLSVVQEPIPVYGSSQGINQAMAVYNTATFPLLRAGESPECRVMYTGSVFGIEARPVLDLLHYLSSGLVGFARGLNDTPKIVALLLLAQAFASRLEGSALGAPALGIVLVAIAIALGGLVSSRRVAETMSLKITEMNVGQGFVANCVTAFLVVFASRIGVPVSTTHVSCGALFGIGLTTGQAHRKVIANILLAWVTTLPVAIVLAGIAVYTLRLL